MRMMTLAGGLVAGGLSLGVPGPAAADTVLQQGLRLAGQVQTRVVDTLQDVIASGRIFWRHEKGDAIRKLCEHRKQAHPSGDATRTPCGHTPVQSHPGGDERHVPCLDPSHASMKGPCKGHKKKVPCVHLKAPHDGHPGPTVPCVHVGPEHPDGDPTGQVTSCIHDLDPVEVDRDLGLAFYQCDAAFRAKVKGWARKLRGWGAKFGAPRTLHVFNRPFLRGPYPSAYGGDAGKDPFWSHYATFEKKARHYLQVARQHGDATAAHELGHAITGDKCVFILSPGGSHQLEGEANRGLALSEGWANFVSAALLLDPGAGSAAWPAFPTQSYDVEGGTRLAASGPPQPIPCNDKKELCTSFMFWDLFDTRPDGADTGSIGFRWMFKVFKPNLESFIKGPAIPNLTDYVDRLCKELGDKGKCDLVKAVRRQNAP